MKIRAAMVLLTALLLPGLLAAQTKVSGTVVCSKPTVEHQVPAVDSTDHSFAVTQSTCSWTKPMQIAGTTTKEDTFTNLEERRADGSTGTGFGVGTLVSGDTFKVRTQDKVVSKAGAVQSSGTWKFDGGTGKVAAIKGGGTYTCVAKPEGFECQVTGNYTLPK
jgi:hypothetical protein